MQKQSLCVAKKNFILERTDLLLLQLLEIKLAAIYFICVMRDPSAFFEFIFPIRRLKTLPGLPVSNVTLLNIL